MRKLIGLIVILALIWGVPSARAKLMTVLAPATSKLGPVGDQASLPMQKYSARTQIAMILRRMGTAREQGKEVPTPRTFVRWLRANPPSDRKELDPWGNGYYMTHENGVYLIGSPGPDGVRGNADDITKTTTL